MNIPLKIVEKGGDTLQIYIKTQIELDDKRVRLAEVEALIKKNMYFLGDLIGDFLPEKDDPYHHHHWRDFDYRTMRIIPKMKKKIDKVVLDIIMAEEMLKNVKPLILEMKGLEFEIAKLKRLQELREQGI